VNLPSLDLNVPIIQRICRPLSPRNYRIIERGKHYQLLLENGTYARLYRNFLQAGESE